MMHLDSFWCTRKFVNLSFFISLFLSTIISIIKFLEVENWIFDFRRLRYKYVDYFESIYYNTIMNTPEALAFMIIRDGLYSGASCFYSIISKINYYYWLIAVIFIEMIFSVTMYVNWYVIILFTLTILRPFHLFHPQVHLVGIYSPW